ncbi:hypothetical protein HKK80_00205 [Halonotius sp. F2-221B]|jgi:hypothetical protein|uniref:hypothetical protein n=1 Tax=Halonotius sp. F2-221B TaxID=2731620 RepID=UPI00398AFFF5
MTNDLRILDGISEWIRERIGPDAENRPDEQPDSGESGTAPGSDDEEESSDRDSPACCSASGNTDVTVFDA